MSDEGQNIASAIKEGAAIAVSDGSYKETFGTAAWVIEGSDDQGRISGRVITPGGSESQSPYRSELKGIYATMIVVHNICSYYQITSGTIEFACDGLSALDRAFSHVSLISVEEPSYDLLIAIRNLWAYSPIQWKIRHVEGHQDDNCPAESLDRWGKLNVEMDLAAKSYIAVAKQRTRHHLFKEKPWTIWYQNQPVVKNIYSTIYEIVHSEEARSYWAKKDKTETHCLDFVNWEAIGAAMKNTPLPKKLFISKQTVGMCGVGKYMKLWKQRDSDKCPRCNEPEDASHVLKCSGEGANDIWTKALKKLEDWMLESQTDPDIQEAVIHSLNQWRYPSRSASPIPSSLKVSMDQQNDIGWQSFLEGWIAMDWECVQQEYYDFLKSRKTGKRWIIALIKKLWLVAWDLWEHRNNILHTQTNAISKEKLQTANRKLSKLFCKYQAVLSSTIDKYLFEVPLQQLLQKDLHYKEEWIKNLESAVQNKGVQASKRAVHRMSLLMKRWLRPRRK